MTTGPGARSGAERSVDAHVVQLYDDRDTLVDAVTAYARSALLHREAVLVVVTAEHRTALAAALAADGLDVDALRWTGQYLELDAEQVLSWATGPDDEVDLRLLIDALGGELDRLVARWRTGQRLRRPGVLPVGARHVAATVRLEHAWDELSRRRPVRLYCGYSSTEFADRGSADEAMQVLTAHSEVRAT